MVESGTVALNEEQVGKILYQKGICRFIDYVLKYDLTSLEKTLTAVYDVPMDPYWLKTHVINGIPVMRGTDIQEAGIQAAQILFYLINKDSNLMLTRLDRIFLRNRVVIGDTLIIKIRLMSINSRGGSAFFSVHKCEDLESILNKDNLVCEGQLTGLVAENTDEDQY